MKWQKIVIIVFSLAISQNWQPFHVEELDRFKDLDEIPSPYLTGISDKFFDG